MGTNNDKVKKPKQVPKKAETPSIHEKIIERRIIIYKTCIDPTVIKLAVERIKKELFVKSGFLKPKPEDIKYISIDKAYEPYVFADGKYFIDYYRRRTFTFNVNEETQEVIFFDRPFKPEPETDPSIGEQMVIKIEGEEHFFNEDKGYIILDKAGNEVSVEQVPFAPSEEDPKKILNESSEKIGKLELSLNEEIDILRSRIVKKPSGVYRVANELFEISDRSVIYIPIYEISFENVKTGEKKSVRIDGVTAKVAA